MGILASLTREKRLWENDQNYLDNTMVEKYPSEMMTRMNIVRRLMI